MTKKDLQFFFKRRMVELLHEDTLDSYRVRVNNAMTILIELNGVLGNWLNGNIKRYETVDYCLQECKSLVECDDCINYDEIEMSKDILNQQIENFVSTNKNGLINTVETMKLQFMVQKCILFNKDNYLNKLLGKIREEINITEDIPEEGFIPKLTKLDNYISAFACELLRLGYSKNHLYKFFIAFKKNKKHLCFHEAFDDMQRKLSSLAKQDYTVIFKLWFQTEELASNANANIVYLKKEVPGDLKESILGKNISYKKTNAKTQFFIMQKSALDSAMAAKKCYDDLSKELDLNLEYTKNVEMPSTALVFCPQQQNRQDYRVTLEHIYVLDKGTFATEEGKSLSEAMNNIEKNANISNDVKDRISVALRHLRIGDHQLEIEQQFINYWIAIEFIFASASSKESTFERIKKFLPNILGSGYIKRNCLYLNKMLKGNHLIGEEDSWWEKSEEEKNYLINSLSNNILMQYRMRKMKAHLRNSDERKAYINNHKKNLEQHISRIYRLRNELIHEAAIKQDIANVTSNLRSYLIYVLNQLIDYFNHNDNLCTANNMSQFFWSYENKMILVSKSKDINTIMNIPIAVGYVS